MKRKHLPALLGAVLIVVIAAALIATRAGAAQKPPAQSSASTDPQRLMIPRWFLNALTLDGQTVEIPPDQQSITLQFAQGGSANGKGGCNEFGTTYTVSPDGKLSFGSGDVHQNGLRQPDGSGKRLLQRPGQSSPIQNGRRQADPLLP